MQQFMLPAGYREFFLMIDQCEKEVELYTGEGFHLNLKSKLCQFVALTSVFYEKKIEEYELITNCEEDTVRLLRFFVS